MSLITVNSDIKSKTAVIYPEILNRPLGISADSRLAEAVGLALAINLEVVHSEITKIREIKPGAFFGQGFIDRLKPQLEELGAELLIVDSSLTPIQQRNLEKKLQLKVIDRTALILEIFGERAQTSEGKLQVELAHLTYQRSRLVRSWTHLERQRGGAGFLGGPGETQIELDRRIIDDKIVRIKKELEKVKQTRSIQRSARKRIPYPVVALVGYTNAAGVLAKDLLFATLDPAMRKIALPSGREIILSDTVGFISDLPHELIMAFRATLEEVLSADIIVHVRDVANPDSREQKQDVIKVLESLGLQNVETMPQYIEVLNKLDLVAPNRRDYIIGQTLGNSNLLALSALTGEGCAAFLRAIDDKLASADVHIVVTLPLLDGKNKAWLYEHAEVLSVNAGEQTADFEIRIASQRLSRLEQLLGRPLT